jgi:hypothetical protein
MSEDDFYFSDEAQRARKHNYQVEVDPPTVQMDFGDWTDNEFAIVPDVVFGKGTVLIDGTRVRFTKHSYKGITGRTDVATALRLAVKDWQHRQDAISIRRAITEALWEEWDKQEAPRLSRQVKREDQEIAKAITDGRLPQDAEQKVAEQLKMTKRQNPYRYVPVYRATISDADYKAMRPCEQVSYNRERLDVTETILRSLSEDLVRTLRTRDEDGERAERGDL